MTEQSARRILNDPRGYAPSTVARARRVLDTAGPSAAAQNKAGTTGTRGGQNMAQENETAAGAGNAGKREEITYGFIGSREVKSNEVIATARKGGSAAALLEQCDYRTPEGERLLAGIKQMDEEAYLKGLGFDTADRERVKKRTHGHVARTHADIDEIISDMKEKTFGRKNGKNGG